MANKFSQGTVVGAGSVIAGVDANNPPVAGSGSSLEMAFLFNPQGLGESHNGMGFDPDVGDFGSDDFMIDFWAYQNHSGNSGMHRIISMRNAYRPVDGAGSSAHWIICRGNGQMLFQYYVPPYGILVQVSWGWPTNNRWNHFSVARSGDVLTLTTYSVEGGSSSVTHNLPSNFAFNPASAYNSGVSIGGGYSKQAGQWEASSAFGSFQGLLADVRIVKGNSVPYSAPVGAAEAIEGTSLLTLQNSTDSVVGPAPVPLGTQGLPVSNTTGSVSSTWSDKIPNI